MNLPLLLDRHLPETQTTRTRSDLDDFPCPPSGILNLTDHPERKTSPGNLSPNSSHCRRPTGLIFMISYNRWVEYTVAIPHNKLNTVSSLIHSSILKLNTREHSVIRELFIRTMLWLILKLGVGRERPYHSEPWLRIQNPVSQFVI